MPIINEMNKLRGGERGMGHGSDTTQVNVDGHLTERRPDAVRLHLNYKTNTLKCGQNELWCRWSL